MSCCYETFTTMLHHKTMFVNNNLWMARLWAASIHFGISLVIALLAALLVFGIWYPYPYREISGGRELFLIVVAVDVIMGPLLTFTVFNRNKPTSELRRDLSMIGFLQLAALAYGLWTVAVARPVHLVFEIDRFRVVHAIEVPEDMLSQAPGELRQLPWSGPTLLAVRDFKDEKENFEATMAALQGVSLSARPDLWQSYAQSKPQVLARARPLAELKTRFPARSQEIDRALSAAGSSVPDLAGYIPMVGRQNAWTVLVDIRSAEVKAFVPIDSF